VRHFYLNDLALMADWVELLMSVRPDEVATEPLVEGCTPKTRLLAF
jgi:hypothetical protein